MKKPKFSVPEGIEIFDTHTIGRDSVLIFLRVGQIREVVALPMLGNENDRLNHLLRAKYPDLYTEVSMAKDKKCGAKPVKTPVKVDSPKNPTYESQAAGKKKGGKNGR